MSIEEEGRSLELVTSFRTDYGQGDSYQKSIVPSPSGRLYGTIGTDGCLLVWEKNELVNEIDAGSEVMGAAFLPNEKSLFYATNDSIFSHKTGANDSTFIQKGKEGMEYRCLACTKDQIIVVENHKDRSGSFITAYSVDEFRLLRSRKLPVKKAVTGIALSNDGDSLAFCSADGTVGIMSASTFKVLKTIPNLHSLSITAVQVFSVDGVLFLLSGSPDGNVKITKLGTSSSVIFWLVLFALLALLVSYLVQTYPQHTSELIKFAEQHVDQWLSKLQ